MSGRGARRRKPDPAGPSVVEHPDLEDLELERVLHALSDPIRMRIVRRLADGSEVACSELDYPVAKSTLSHHLRTLRLCGLTHTELFGTTRILTLRREDLERRFPGLLAAVGAADPAGPADPAAEIRSEP